MTDRPVQVEAVVFLDTSGLIALTSKRDVHHAAARNVERAIESRRSILVTSQLVLTEYLNAMCEKRARVKASNVVSTLLRSSRTDVVDIDASAWRESLAFYDAHPDKSWSLVDCNSMQICRRRNIRQVFCADNHFAQAGFEVLLPIRAAAR